jgi:hypothetical protein
MECSELAHVRKEVASESRYDVFIWPYRVPDIQDADRGCQTTKPNWWLIARVPNENISTTKGKDGVTCLSMRVKEVTEPDILCSSTDMEGYTRSLFSHFLESSISTPMSVGP